MPQNEFPKILKRAELAQNLSPKYYYFLSNYGLGDIFFVLCFKSAIESRLNGKIILVVRDYHRPILEIFNESDYIIIADLERCDYFYDISSNVPAKGAIYPAHWVPLKKRVKDYTIKELYLSLFDLPLDTPPVFPTNMPTLSRDLKARLESIAPLDKIIFYAPEANSTRSLPRIILKADYQKAQKQGFTIIINAEKSTRYDLQDTYNLHLPLKDALALAISCHSVIAMRSGFCDIIAPFCRNLKVYHTDNLILIHQWNLKGNGLSKNAEELTIRDRLFGLGGIERTLAYRFYKRLIMRGLWKRLKCPLALLRLYLRYKDTPTPSVENPAVLESYEYQLGLATLRIYQARFNPLKIARFLRDYPRIRRLPRLKTFALAHYRAHFAL